MNPLRHSGPAFKRLILPLLAAIAVAGAIEFFINYRFAPSFWQKTTWLMHDPYRGGDLFDRTIIYEKLSHFENSDPEIISVGDSSGFFSLQSTVVNRYTHGHKYLSLNTGANQAYAGYEGIAEYMLKRSKHLKYVVLYLYPQLLPHEGLFAVADLAPILHDNLVGLKSYITPPSAFLSAYAKTWLFEGAPYHVGEPPNGHPAVLQLWSTADDALGWLPEFDVRFDRVDGRIGFGTDARSGWSVRLGLGEKSALNATLGEFYDMVRSYDAHLVIAFAPFPDRAAVAGDVNRQIAEQQLARFQSEHPDVKFLFPLITRWGSEKFGIFNHISREYTFLSSKRLGKGLERLLTDPASIPPFVRQFQEPGPYQPIEAKPLGPPDPDLVKPALALYLYTSTGDESQRQLFSKRVENLLAKEDSFQFMMDDARARLASLAKRDIKIDFDLSQIRATPVQVTGLSHCDSRTDVQWVQLDGTMISTFTSPRFNAKDPFDWPKTSHIYIPTVIEDGVRKFDGYCPQEDG